MGWMHTTHRQEQYSNAFILAIAAVAGCSAAKPSVDNDTIDWTLSNRLPRRPKIDIQLKCTQDDSGTPDSIRFVLSMKNYRDLILADVSIPRILVVVIVPTDIADWLDMTPASLALRRHAYWVSLSGQPESENETTITVEVPRTNSFSVAVLEGLMQHANDRIPL
jgi:hypothetical protein